MYLQKIDKKYVITKDDVLTSNNVISFNVGCYPPNIIKIIGNRIYYYHGLEEGLMCWDSIDIRKLKKWIRKYYKDNNEI